MANTFLVAKGHTVGKSLLERDRVDDAKRILERAEKRGVAAPAADRHRGRQGGHPRRRAQGRAGPQDPQQLVGRGHRAPDASRRSRRRWSRRRPSFWNGPLGVFEVPTFGDGTRAMARYLAQARRGGRDGRGRRRRLGGGGRGAEADLDTFTHISTGGGASLEFLEGRELPGIAVLQDRPGPPSPRGQGGRASQAGLERHACEGGPR